MTQANESCPHSAVLAVLAITIVASACARGPLPRPSTAIAARGAVLTITTAGAGGAQMSQGTGFLIDSSGTAVTDFHVLSGSSSAAAKLGDGRLFQVLWAERYSMQDDLAVVQLGRSILGKDEFPSGLPSLHLSAGPAAVGQRVSVISSPEGLASSLSEGLVSAIREGGKFQFTAPVSHGSSGGPVLDSQADVLGIVDSTVSSGENLNFATAAAKLRHLMSFPSEPVPLSNLWRSGVAGYIRSRSGAPSPSPIPGDNDDSDTVALYAGRITNQTAGISAPAGLVLLGDQGRLRGCFAVGPPLIGSAPIKGTLKGETLRAETLSRSVQMGVAGRLGAESLSGAYEVYSARAGPETGYFQFHLVAFVAPPGRFTGADCPSDADMSIK